MPKSARNVTRAQIQTLVEQLSRLTNQPLTLEGGHPPGRAMRYRLHVPRSGLVIPPYDSEAELASAMKSSLLAMIAGARLVEPPAHYRQKNLL